MDTIFSLHFYLNKLRFGSLFILITLLYSCSSEPKSNNGQKIPASAPTTTKVVNLYTNRYKQIEADLYKRFEQEKGIKVNVYTATAEELLSRMKSEANAVTTDVVIFDDLTWMYQAKTAGILQPFATDSITHTTNSRNVDYEGTWVGLSKWALGYGCNRSAVPSPNIINTYQDILDDKWKGRVLLTAAANNANVFLVATMITEQGEKATAQWLKKLISNLAMPPLANEAALIKALADRKGDISFLNASEHIRWTNSGNPENFKIGERVGVKTPFDVNDKTYYNITAAGVLLNAPNRQNALTFLDFLISKKSQQYYGDLTFEYPVNVFAIPSDFLRNIGGFQEKTLDFNTTAKNMNLARQLMQKAGWK